MNSFSMEILFGIINCALWGAAFRIPSFSNKQRRACLVRSLGGLRDILFLSLAKRPYTGRAVLCMYIYIPYLLP